MVHARARTLAGALLAFILSLGLGALAPTAHAAGPADDPVVAKVNGEEIHRSDVAMALRLLPPQLYDMDRDVVVKALVGQLVDLKLAAAAARKQGLEQDEEVRRRLAFYEERLLRETFFDRTVAAQVTPERIKARFEEMKKEAAGKEEVRARHIVVETEEEAKKLRAELEKGADFAELARKHSTGPSGAQGGEVGFFTREAVVPEFAEAAFALKPGEISQPVKTRFGWHLIQVEERRPAPPPVFDEVKDKIRSELAEKAVNELMAKLRGEAEIERFEFDTSTLPWPPSKESP